PFPGQRTTTHPRPCSRQGRRDAMSFFVPFRPRDLPSPSTAGGSDPRLASREPDMLHTPSPGAPRRWLLAASLLMALGSCADQTPAADRNDCGGTGDLTFEAKAAAPGDGCGVCGEGRLVCDGQEALRCEGAR